MAKNTFKNADLRVAGHDPVHGGASLITWLLGQGARVTVTGAAESDATTQLMRRVDAQLRRSAPDGRTYEDMRARLRWTARKSADTIDALALFSRIWPGRVIGVAGTLGKTTAATWAGHIIRTASVVGTVPERGYFSALTDRAKTAVVEIHGNQQLTGTRFITVSTDEAATYLAEESCLSRIDAAAFCAAWGEHNLNNLATAVRAARCAGVTEDEIVRRIAALPSVPYREEVVLRDSKLIVVNDAAARSPVAGAAAVARWGGPTTILIAGGNGPDGDYRPWAQAVATRIRPTNIVFCAGDAVPAMRRALRRHRFTVRAHETLSDAWRVALSRALTYVASTVLYSPAVREAGLSDDVFERGQEFNASVSSIMRR